jgi:hypothetical protein
MSWYREGIHALVSPRRKAVDVDGDYVEKYMCKGNIQLYCASISYVRNKQFPRKKKWGITF